MAVDAGKLVVILLRSPEIVFAATGTVTHSGTGRNSRATRHVEELASYSAVPVKWKIHEAHGTEMAITPEARLLIPYWTEFAKSSRYEVYVEGEFKEALVRTKTGARTVSIVIRKGRGALLAVPVLDLEDESFYEHSTVNGQQEIYWSKHAVNFEVLSHLLL